MQYNADHGITPRGVVKSVDEVRFITRVADARLDSEERAALRKVAEAGPEYDAKELDKLIAQLEDDMRTAAADLDFETAARLRDEVFELRARRDGAQRRPRDAFARIRAAK